jgi:outer membrane protein OmpA-like peptidoglycan-associated protein
VGDASEDPKLMGCPGDRDGDGIPDLKDACVDLPGEANEDPRSNGCPADPDGDGIEYAADACPFERGAADPNPQQNGCPRFVRVTQDEIVIKQRIEFTTYGAKLNEAYDSTDLLTEVKDVIESHPEYQTIEVQGHTDDMGNEEFNQQLSQRRAEAVREWLVEHGIAPERLVAKGYGFTKPIADNRVRTGRQANRRVQFVIVRRSKPSKP